jgi:hypothetical protein
MLINRFTHMIIDVKNSTAGVPSPTVSLLKCPFVLCHFSEIYNILLSISLPLVYRMGEQMSSDFWNTNQTLK